MPSMHDNEYFNIQGDAHWCMSNEMAMQECEYTNTVNNFAILAYVLSNLENEIQQEIQDKTRETHKNHHLTKP